MTTIDRPALRYHGSKFKLSSWIISHFPEHECYVEPFGGGASVLLLKPRSWLEVYNDADGDVVNFFSVLRNQADELIRAIELTPYAKAEWELSYQECDDPLEAARRFYVRSYQNIAGATAQWRSGWRRQKVISHDGGGSKKMTPAPISFMNVSHLYQIAERLRGVQIESDFAGNVITRYDSPETLFYLDPPYPASTRGRWAKHAYRFEITDRQHLVLAEMVHSLQGMVILSGYQCELYDQAYSDWERIDRKARVNGAGSAVESLWVSPQVKATQPSLFVYAESG